MSPSATVLRKGSVAAETVTGRRHQHGEGIVDAPCQIEQHRELRDVVGEQCGSEPHAQAVARGVPDREEDVEPRGYGDHDQAHADRQREAEPERYDQDRHELAEHRDPSQPHDGIDAQAAVDGVDEDAAVPAFAKQ